MNWEIVLLKELMHINVYQLFLMTHSISLYQLCLQTNHETLQFIFRHVSDCAITTLVFNLNTCFKRCLSKVRENNASSVGSQV